GQAPISPTPFGKKIVQARIKTTAGDIIARQFIDGPQIVGQSRAQLRQVAAAVDRGFDEALNDEQLPRKYHEAHMHYFGELKRLVEVVQDSRDESAEPAPVDEPESGD
ncbi:MAG: hypothetical protein IH889_01660, partial [Planctomycetes bacterium]|nr:hypothetical protein [Planctomycetota bacterium]